MTVQTQDLLFEIGTEELPAHALYKAAEHMSNLMAKKLGEHEISYADIEVFFTPRRMTACVSGVLERTDDQVMKVKGPAASVAFDADGKLTRAGMGFAASKGVTSDQLISETDDSGRTYVYATVVKPGVEVADLLRSLLAEVVAEIAWPRSQRWGVYRQTFARPIRWMVALFGTELIDVSFADVVSSRISRGHRLLANHDVELSSASRDDYVQAMRDAYVMVDAHERCTSIKQQIAELERVYDVQADLPQKTFDEVVNLVEWPSVMCASFDQEFLEVPSEIITDAMLEHQRYFPLYTHEGALTNRFVLVSNGNPHRAETIVEGNERVVRARLSDAAFFYREDLKRPLADYIDDLQEITFHEKLGTLRDKAMRVARLIEVMPSTVIDADTKRYAHRAALLCKADLTTSAVIEFTSLQGVMGGYYALASGEHQEVATAITQHYQPKFATDNLPETLVSRVVALCDRLDTIAGIFAAQEGPTGSSDPYAIRRQTIAAIRLARVLPELSLEVMIAHALDQYMGVLDFDYHTTLDTIRAFFKTRMAVIAREDGVAHDVIEALQSLDVLEPIDFFARIDALLHARQMHPERFERLSMAYSRAHNLSSKSKVASREVNQALMQDAERALFEVIEKVTSLVNRDLDQKDYARVFEDLELLVEPIDTFFDEVLVMDKDEDLKCMRIALLNRFVDVFHNIANLGALHG